MSEIQETRKPSKLKLTYIVTAVAISCLMIGASLGSILSATTPSIPTVIEPGSMVSTADYVIFQDGVTSYAKNATTGHIDYTGTNALTLFNSVLGQLSRGGTIFVQDGIYTFAPSLIITTRQIIINGVSQSSPNSITPFYEEPYGTRFVGNVTVKAPNVQLNNLAIIGILNFTSTDDYSSIANFCSASHLYVYGSIAIVGLPGAADAEVPYDLHFTNTYVLQETAGVNAVSLRGLSSGIIQHVYFDNSVLFQGASGSLIWVQQNVNDVVFTNCLWATYSATAFLNLTGAGTKNDFHFNGGIIEANGGSSQVLVAVGVGTGWIKVSISDTSLTHANLIRYLVRDDSTTTPSPSGSPKEIIFSHFLYTDTTLRVRGADPFPKVLIKFVDSIFYTPLALTQLSGQYIGDFINCRGINPYGVIATPFTDFGNSAWAVISLASSYTRNAAPTASYNYTLHDTAILLTASGGSGLSISIYDPNGNAVVSGASSLTGYYVPIGFKINFGGFSGGPTITVVGV